MENWYSVCLRVCVCMFSISEAGQCDHTDLGFNLSVTV